MNLHFSSTFTRIQLFPRTYSKIFTFCTCCWLRQENEAKLKFIIVSIKFSPFLILWLSVCTVSSASRYSVRHRWSHKCDCAHVRMTESVSFPPHPVQLLLPWLLRRWCDARTTHKCSFSFLPITMPHFVVPYGNFSCATTRRRATPFAHKC